MRPQRILLLSCAAAAATIAVLPAAISSATSSGVAETCAEPPTTPPAPPTTLPPVDTPPPVATAPPVDTPPPVDTAAPVETEPPVETAPPTSQAPDDGIELVTSTSEAVDVSVTDDLVTTTGDVTSSLSSAIGLRIAQAAPADGPPVAPPPRPVTIVDVKVEIRADKGGVPISWTVLGADGKPAECNQFGVGPAGNKEPPRKQVFRLSNVRNMDCTLVSFTIDGVAEGEPTIAYETIQPNNGPRYRVPLVHYTAGFGVNDVRVVEFVLHCTPGRAPGR